MVMATKFYLCTTCGNVIIKCVDSGVGVVCCGKPMKELIPSTEDTSHEKHLPAVEFLEGGKIKVKIGKQPHPMMAEHHISFIYLETNKGGQIKYLTSEQAPETEFFLKEETPIAVYEYCNIHGLWKKDLLER